VAATVPVERTLVKTQHRGGAGQRDGFHPRLITPLLLVAIASGSWGCSTCPTRGADFNDDLVVIGKVPRFVLRVDQSAIDAYVEHAATALDELCVEVERFV
jgi:hypothetical protein